MTAVVDATVDGELVDDRHLERTAGPSEKLSEKFGRGSRIEGGVSRANELVFQLGLRSTLLDIRQLYRNNSHSCIMGSLTNVVILSNLFH